MGISRFFNRVFSPLSDKAGGPSDGSEHASSHNVAANSGIKGKFDVLGTETLPPTKSTPSDASQLGGSKVAKVAESDQSTSKASGYTAGEASV